MTWRSPIFTSGSSGLGNGGRGVESGPNEVSLVPTPGSVSTQGCGLDASSLRLRGYGDWLSCAQEGRGCLGHWSPELMGGAVWGRVPLPGGAEKDLTRGT